MRTSILARTMASDLPRAIRPGRCYSLHNHLIRTSRRILTSLETKSLIAFDLSDGRQLWNYTFPVDEPSVVTIDASNRLDNIPYDTSWNLSDTGPNSISSDLGEHTIVSYAQVPEVISSNGRVYAYFRSSNYEIPITIGKSKTAYVSGVYALDMNGSAPVESDSVSVGAYDMNVVSNSTIFYRDGNGNLVVTGTGAARGLLTVHIAHFHPTVLARAIAPIQKNLIKIYRIAVRAKPTAAPVPVTTRLPFPSR